MGNQQVTTLELGWLIGAIDGEGCVGITKRNRTNTRNGFTLKPHVQVANCDRSFIERYCAGLHGLGVPFHVSFTQNKNPKRRDNWTVITAGLKRVAKLLPFITELLCDEKREKARLVLEYCESRLNDWHAAPFTRRQLEIVDRLYALNTRGRESRLLRDYTPEGRSSKYRFTRATQDIVQTATDTVSPAS